MRNRNSKSPGSLCWKNHSYAVQTIHKIGASGDCIACPFAYHIINLWLKNFVFRIDLEVWTFVLSEVFVLAIALLTVSFQSIKEAMVNLANSLHSE